MANYYEAVYALVRQIPAGRVSTYGRIATCLDLGSPRMVGWALNQAIKAKDEVPAHRVVNRKGRLTGKMHFETPTLMEQLLRNEGIEVVEDCVQDFESKVWTPCAS